jgi:hypothetical protein
VTVEDKEVLDWLAMLPVSLRKRGVVLTRDVSRMEQEIVTMGTCCDETSTGLC